MTRYWPDTLPSPIGPGFGLEAVDQFLRTEMEVGTARTRRLTRARRDRVQAVWVMTPAEFEAYRAWHDDAPWSLAGDSDDLSSWAAAGAAWIAGTGLGASGQLTGRIVETGVGGEHGLSRPISGLPDASEAHIVASLRAAGRNIARVGLSGRDGTVRAADINILTGATVWTSAGITVRVTEQAEGWWRAELRAQVGSGLSQPALRISLLAAPGMTSYAGDGISGADVSQINLRQPGSSNLYLPTDATGRARGAAGGAAWALIPVFTGGPLKPVECRFEAPFSVEVRPGLHTHVTGQLEVRHA